MPPVSKPHRSSGLEREVITAVVVLYLVLSGAMLIVHFVLGGDEVRPSITSSTSPSHAAREILP